MRITLISYSNKPFFRSQQLLKQSALEHGVDDVVSYNDIWLKRQTAFYKKNKSILSVKRGDGYWLWKPFILLDALKKMNEGDILVHIDAGTLFINNIAPLVSLLEKKDLLLFYNNGHKNKTWTKRDCFFYMNCDTKQFHMGDQLLAGYIVCKKTPEVIGLFKEWLKYAEDERIISDNPNACGLGNLDGFIEHRHDQSILSLLAMKYNIELFRDPSQWGNRYKAPEYRENNEFIEGNYLEDRLTNSRYPTILESHRTKMKLRFRDHLKYFLLRFKKDPIR